MKSIVNKALEFAKECHGGDCSGHDYEHILRVLSNVEKMLEQMPQADATLARLGAILHDVDDYKLGKNSHKVDKFLDEYCSDVELKEKVRKVVNTISYSKSGDKPNFDMIEQKIVSDADKLDAMGAIGVCRAVIYSAVTKRALFDNEQKPKEKLSQEEYMNKNREENHTINHFFDKLLKLRSAMQTEVGRKEAERRHKFMIAFLTQFFDEVSADISWYERLKKF